MFARKPTPTGALLHTNLPHVGPALDWRDLEGLAELIAAVVREELRAHDFQRAAPTTEFVDKHTSGLGPSVFLAAARAGEFDTFRVGKRYVARADDVRAYIERQKVAPLHAGRGGTPRVDEFDAQLGARTRATRTPETLGPAVATARRR